MKTYLDLLRHVRENGARKDDRTGIGTLSVFGYQMRFNPGFAKVTLSFVGTYLTEWKSQAGKDFPYMSYLGNSFNGGNAYPRWTHVASMDFERGPWLGTIEQTYTLGWTEAFQGGGTHEVPGVSRINLAAKYSGFRNLTLKLGVRNVLDHLPPYTDVSSNGSHAAGWANAVADPRGRFWYGVITFNFK